MNLKNLLKYAIPALFIGLFLAFWAYADNPNFWLLSSSYLKPISSSWGLQLPGLTSQNCLGTDGSGHVQAGTCSGGGGGSGGGFSTSSPNIIFSNYPNSSNSIVGINSSTPIADLSVVGISGSTTPIFVVASSSGTSLIQVNSSGTTFLGNLSTNGFVKTSGGNGQLSVDTNTYLTGNQTITLTGDVTGSGATSIATAYNNIVPTNKGGTGTSTSPSQTGQVLLADSTGTLYGPAKWVNGSNITISTSTAGQITIATVSAPTFSGTVTGGGFTISGQATTDCVDEVNGVITILSADCVIGSGTNGKVARWSGPQTATTGYLIDNGSVAGAGASSSNVSFFVQGIGGNNNAFVVASSTGTYNFQVTSSGVSSSTNIIDSGVVSALELANSSGQLTAYSPPSNCGNATALIGITAVGAYNCSLNGLQAALTNPDTGTGTNGQVAYFTGATSLTSASAFLYNGTVVGINATSSTVSLNIKGTGTLDPINIASSSGTSILTVKSSELTGIGSSTPNAVLVVEGINEGANTTTPILIIATSTNTSILQVTASSQILACATCRLTIPQQASPSVTAAGDVAIDTNGDQFIYGGLSGSTNVITATTSKTMTIIAPTASEDDDFFRTDVPIHVTKVTCSVRNQNTSSVTFSLWHGADRSTPSEYLVSGQTCTATTTPASVTLSTTDLEAGDVLVATTSATTLASTTSFTVYFTTDKK